MTLPIDLPSFTLALPGETRFGWGCVAELPDLLTRYGARVALARGGRGFDAHLRGQLMPLLDGLHVIELPPQTREPEPEDVDAAVALVRDAGAQVVLAMGGGSVLDLGKAVAALVPQPAPAPVRAFLEGVGEGRVLEADPLPFIAVPTTAGTGAEATKNAVISSQRECFKKSLRDRRMLADVALLDPELIISVPQTVTAYTGLDALTQLIEAFTSCRAQPVTDALALAGLGYARALPAAVADGSHREARTQMLLAAYLSGVCLANAGLGAAHGIAAGMGSLANVPHGLACALALPWVMAANAGVARERLACAGEALAGRADAHAAIVAIWELMQHLQIPRVRALPIVAPLFDDARLPALVAASHGNSLRGNPRPLADEDLLVILRAMRDAESPLALL